MSVEVEIGTGDKITDRIVPSTAKPDIYGNREGAKFEIGFGTQQAEIKPEIMDLSLKRIAKILAAQLKIENGTITLESVNFHWARRVE